MIDESFLSPASFVRVLTEFAGISGEIIFLISLDCVKRSLSTAAFWTISSSSPQKNMTAFKYSLAVNGRSPLITASFCGVVVACLHMKKSPEWNY